MQEQVQLSSLLGDILTTGRGKVTDSWTGIDTYSTSWTGIDTYSTSWTTIDTYSTSRII